MNISEPVVWIAIFALAITVIVACQNWKHNQLSVLPNVDMHRHVAGNENYISIKSTGLGPARIGQITVTIEDETFDLSTHHGVNDFITGVGKAVITDFSIIGDGTFMLPNESQKILLFIKENSETVMPFMGRLSFTIKWSSVYGKKFDEVFPSANESDK